MTQIAVCNESRTPDGFRYTLKFQNGRSRKFKVLNRSTVLFYLGLELTRDSVLYLDMGFDKMTDIFNDDLESTIRFLKDLRESNSNVIIHHNGNFVDIQKDCLSHE